jgi:hypothetical protein
LCHYLYNCWLLDTILCPVIFYYSIQLFGYYNMLPSPRKKPTHLGFISGCQNQHKYDI